MDSIHLPGNLIEKAFELIKIRIGVSAVACHDALEGLGAGIIAFKYPGILYWGFTNVNEILKIEKIATTPGIWLLAQFAATNVWCLSSLQDPDLWMLYPPSLMIGAAVFGVFGGSAVPGSACCCPGTGFCTVSMMLLKYAQSSLYK